MKISSRVEKLEAALSPKQILLRFLREQQKFKSNDEYRIWLVQDPQERGGLRMSDQQLAAWLEGRGWSKSRGVKKRALLALEELLFLEQLYFMVKTLPDQSPGLLAVGVALAYRVEALGRQLLGPADLLIHVPYPLDAETGRAAEAAIGSQVQSFDRFIREVCGWRNRRLRELEMIGLPQTSERLEARERILVELANGISALWRTGAISGDLIQLKPFPYSSLSSVPVLDGDWVDRHMIELAEWAALLEAQGLEFRMPDDTHVLAPETVWVHGTANPAPPDLLAAYRAEAKEHVARFAGRVQEIHGRPYLNLGDYRDWGARKTIGPLQVMKGVAVYRWNAWIDENGGDQAQIAGVKLGKLWPSIARTDFVSCDDPQDLDNRLMARQLILLNIGSSRTAENVRERNLLEIRNAICSWLSRLLVIKGAINDIADSYFDSRPLLFRAEADALDLAIKLAESLVSDFDALVIKWRAGFAPDGQKSRRALKIDLDNLHSQACETAEKLADGLVITAKAKVAKAKGDHRGASALLYSWMKNVVTDLPNPMQERRRSAGSGDASASGAAGGKISFDSLLEVTERRVAEETANRAGTKES